jgi:putative CRISPR-associated protein (TIGR02619 family)
VGLETDDRVVLLHTDTLEGLFCAERLQGYLQRGRCRSAVLRPLVALSYQTSSFAQRGLRSLVSEALTAVNQGYREGLEPVFCATGGFKAEIAFLNLLGALLQIEVCYIHEQFREIVRLPRLPLAWDAEFVARNLDFFEWIDSELRSSVEVENWLKGRPELRPLVEDDPDGHTYLNAAGDLLFKAARQQLARGPRVTWPEASPLAPHEKNGLSGVEHHRPRGWERFVDRLCAIDCVSRVAFDAAVATGPSVKVLDAAEGKIGDRYAVGDQILPLAVSTTARGQAQTELVAGYLRRVVK